MHLQKILLPTDLSQRSKRGLRYAFFLATEYRATITVIYVANDLDSWELHCDEFSFMMPVERAWPSDRVMAEASLELSNFLEPYSETIKRLPAIYKRVALGPIVDEIVIAAEDLQADLIVMSPRRLRGIKTNSDLQYHRSGHADKSLSGFVRDRSSSFPPVARQAYK
jgi:nucleotide-binding universal stress UspA family protein